MKKKNHKKVTTKTPHTIRSRKANKFDSLILNMDQIYEAINKVQLKKQDVTLIIRDSDSEVFDNIVKDLALKVQKCTHVPGCLECVRYTIFPPAETPLHDAFLDELDEFPDEIAEDGQIFFD